MTRRETLVPIWYHRDMSKNDRRILGEINGVLIVEPRPDDHMFSHRPDGDRPGEGRIACTCGWVSVSAPPELLDLDIHFAEVNGISYDEQRARTAKTMHQLRGDQARGIACPEPKCMN
jgi:hypothetical protein